MDSKEERERELPSAGELDEETIARKKSRRVSFADITAVHVFDRDEDYETPPESTQGSSGGGADKETVGLSDKGDSSASLHAGDGEQNGDDDEEEEGDQELFVRDMDSSSPGSAVGSMTSNDGNVSCHCRKVLFSTFFLEQTAESKMYFISEGEMIYW